MKTPRAMQVFLTIWCAWTAVQQAALAAPTPCPRPCQCYVDDKGKQAANCTGVPVADGGVTATWPQTVLRVRLDDGPVTLKDRAFARFPRLTYLDIGGGALRHVGARAFDGLPELVELNVIGAGVRRVHRDAFAGNPKLAFLSLSRNPGIAVAPSFLASQSLAELDVSECALTALKSAYFDALPGLKYLSAAGNRLTAVGRQFAPAGLKYADLSNNRIETVHDDLEAYKRLRTVVMTGNPVDCTCDLAETGRRLTARGVSFADTVSCRNARGRSLDDLAEACSRSSADAMMGDDPEGDIYESDDLLKVDEETARRQQQEQLENGSGSGSGDEPLPFSTEDSSSSSTAEPSSSTTSGDDSDSSSSTAEPSSTIGDDFDAAAASSSTAIPVSDVQQSSSALPVEQYATESTSPTPSSSSQSPAVAATGIVVSNPILLPKDDGHEEAGGDDAADDGGDRVAAAMGYVRSNALVTGVAVVLAVIVVAIVYKAVCAGRGRGIVGGSGGDDDRKAVELKEIKYTAADADDTSRPQLGYVARGGRHNDDDDDDDEYELTAAGSSAEENLLGDRDDDDDDDDTDEDDDDAAVAASTPPTRAGPQPNGGDMVKIELGPGTALQSGGGVVPTRVVVKLGETPKACKPVTIDNVH